MAELFAGEPLTPTLAASLLHAPKLGFVLFFFSYGLKQKHLGAGEVRACPRCHNTTQWARMREFKQISLFFIPVARWNRQQFEACGICGTTVAV